MKYLTFLLILILFPLASAFDFPDTTNDVNIFQGNLTNLSEMQDVNIPAPTDDQLLQFDSGTNTWIASTISLTDTNASTACSGTDYLAGNGSCLSPTGSGDITEVNTDGSYLSGGGVTGAISILLNTTALQSWASNLYCKLTGCTMTGDFKLQGFTNGSILFIDQDGRITQNNTNLFYEADNGGKVAIGDNSKMNNAFQVVKSEGITIVDNIKALVVARNKDTTNNNWAGFSWQTYDTAGDIYSGARVLTQFTNHSTGSVSGDLVFDTRNLGVRSEKMRLNSEGNLNMSGLGNITAPYYFGDGSQLTGILTTDTNASTACSGSTTYLDGEGNCDDISEVYADISVTDTNETTRFNTLVGTDCGAGNYSYGFDSNGLIQCREDTGAGSDTNASTACSTTEVLLGNGTCYDSDNFYDDTDTTYTNGTGLSLVGTAFSLIGSIFSGSWNDLTDMPSGFSDGIDNDTADGLTHLTNFTDDIGVSADWDEISDVPTATPSDGDTTHLSTADQIHDWVISLSYLVSGDLVGLLGNWSADKSSYWDTSADLDTVISDDEIAEDKIAFSTACVAGNHYYLNGNDLACEADDDTTYTAEEDLIYLDGTEFKSNKTILNNSIEVYGYIDSYIDTNASTACSGSTTYLDGEGNCDDISGVYINEANEGNLNVNHSTTSGTATTWDGETSQANLNVNSSNYWDGLGSPSDISTGDLTDDGTFRLNSWDNITGIPTATPSDGDTTHLSTADQIRDWVIGLTYVTTSYVDELISSVGNWSDDKSDYWNASLDLDTVIATDEITELKIDFNTVCVAGNHLYVDGNNLACEADDDTTYTAEEDLIYLDGTEFKSNKTILNNSIEVYGYIDSYIDTNASTACSGSTTYLDGEGNCDDISGVYINEANEGNLNVNHSTTSGTATTWDGETSQANLNVNSSNYWDGLGSPSDISTGDLTDDGTFRLNSWDNITGIPTATPSDGDTTHLSTADQIRDWVIGLTYVTTSYVDELISSVGNWSDDKSDYWNASLDLDTVIATDEITELKIDFNTVCVAGNHLYVDGNNLACEADDDTTYTAEEDLIYLDGTEFKSNKTILNNSIEVYGYIDSYIDTNASTACSGSTTYLDGEGNCDDISGVYADISVTDTNETTRFNTLVGTDCGAGNYSYGFDSNGLIQCREDVDTNTDTQDLSYDAGTNVISLVDGGSIDITEVDTNTIYTAGNKLYLTGEEFNVNDTELNTSIESFGYSTTTGTVTSVATDNAYLTGGAITTTGTITFNTTLAGTSLAVDSADKWDALDSLSDINAGDITDDGTYRLNSWNNLTGIPHATPTNGDVTHFSLADEIYDFVIALGYATTTYVDNLVGTYTHLTNFTDDLGDRGYTSNSNFTNDEGYTTNTGTVTSIATTAPIAGGTITTTGTISLTACSDTEIYKYNSTSSAWECEADADTIYTAGSGITLTGYQFNHTDTSSQSSSDNSGNTFIQDIVLDTFGHITSIVTASVDFSSYTATSGLVAILGNWSADKSSYWDTSTDLDTVISDDEIAEGKIAFSTACGAGNHYYLSGNDLACEADDDTTYTAGNGIALAAEAFSVAGNTALTQDADGLSVTADGIGDTQLAFNTGQHLTTTSNPQFNNLTSIDCIVFDSGGKICSA